MGKIFAVSQGSLTPRCPREAWLSDVIDIVAEPEPVPVLYGRSRWEGPAPAPDSSSTLDKTEEILNYILFACSNID